MTSGYLLIRTKAHVQRENCQLFELIVLLAGCTAMCMSDKAQALFNICVSVSDGSVCYAIGVRSIAFPANGDCLLAAVQDGLNVWAWEPVRRLDTVDAPWAKVTV